MQIDREYAREALVRLVQTNSVNPELTAGAPGERAVAEWIAGALRGLGVEVELREPAAGRVTVLGCLRGAGGGGHSLMWNAHLDTVGVEGMPDPFSGEIREGKLYGRGAYDMKGSLAAMLAGVKALCESGARLRGDLYFAGVCDEEYGSLGTEDLVKYLPRVDGAIVTEPTALDVCLAHKGYLWIDVDVYGRAAHGSKFQLGVDANMKMGRVLHELDALERDLRARMPHPLVGPPSLHAALLAGGTGLSTYAARCNLKIERRTVPGETSMRAAGEVLDILGRLTAEAADFRATANVFFSREPFEIAPSAEIVQAVHRAAAGVRGAAPRHMGDTPWMDSALLAAAGTEAVIIGPAGGGAHAEVEWVELESVYALAEILAEAAVDYCG